MRYQWIFRSDGKRGVVLHTWNLISAVRPISIDIVSIYSTKDCYREKYTCFFCLFCISCACAAVSCDWRLQIEPVDIPQQTLMNGSLHSVFTVLMVNCAVILKLINFTNYQHYISKWFQVSTQYKCADIIVWSVLAVDRRSRIREQKITSGRSPFT